MQDALKTMRGRSRRFFIIFSLRFTHGRPVGLLRLFLASRIFFLAYLLLLRLPLVYFLCTLGCAPFALFNIFDLSKKKSNVMYFKKCRGAQL